MTGTVLGWTGNISEELKDEKYNDIKITNFHLKWIGSCATLGAMIMCFPTGIICEKIGRRLALLLLTVPLVGGWLFIIFANCVMMIYIGRFITGMALGAFLVVAPLYTSEIAEKGIRGGLVTRSSLISLGVLVAFLISYLVNPKLYTIIIAILPLLFATVFLFQPESPVYDVKKGREAKARATLIRLRGSSYDIDGELEEIKAAIEENKKNQISLVDSISKIGTRRAALMSFSLMFFQQAAGINAVIFYTSSIFKSSGAELDPNLATVVVSTAQVTTALISSFVVDKLGKRILWLGSNLVMGVGLIILGVFFTLSKRSLVSPKVLASLSCMPLLGVLLYIIAFPVGCGPIPWTMTAELFPPEIKGVAVATASTISWFMAFLITNFYFDVKEAIGADVTFYIFAAFCITGAIFIFLVVPETKGKSLYEIQKELNAQTRLLAKSDIPKLG